MRHIIWKFFWNFEKEERWLNEMAAKGLALAGYSWCRYVFEECEAGEYNYRIELLEQLPTHPESSQYIRFMAENGAEQVASYIRWVYFRRKSAEGSFDIYSDLDSRIRHYRRVFQLWLTLAVAEGLIGGANLIIGLATRTVGSATDFNLILGGLLAAICLAFLALALYYRRTIKRLQRERIMME